jgi:hypothetical protein
MGKDFSTFLYMLDQAKALARKRGKNTFFWRPAGTSIGRSNQWIFDSKGTLKSYLAINPIRNHINIMILDTKGEKYGQ